MTTNNMLVSEKQFYKEMNKLIYYFEQIIATNKYETNYLKSMSFLIQKLISNSYAANFLILNKHIQEAKILLRSAVETVILITYLSQFPEKIKEYWDEAQILKMKNNFIAYKLLKDGETSDINGQVFTKEDFAIENEKSFLTIQKNVQEQLLKKIGVEKYYIDKNNFSKFDKFYTNYRPQFMKYEQMYKDLDKIHFKIDDKYPYTLKDIVYNFYNESSQIAHSCFLDWNHDVSFTQKEAEYMFHFFIKSTLFLKVLLKDKLELSSIDVTKYLKKMKKAHDNLELLVYKRKIKH